LMKTRNELLSYRTEQWDASVAFDTGGTLYEKP
jgi:hypothetical protein